MSRISAPALRTWAQRWMRQAHALDSPQPLAPPGGVGARGQHCQVGEACGCRGCAVSAAQAVGGALPHLRELTPMNHDSPDQHGFPV